MLQSTQLFHLNVSFGLFCFLFDLINCIYNKSQLEKMLNLISNNVRKLYHLGLSRSLWININLHILFELLRIKASIEFFVKQITQLIKWGNWYKIDFFLRHDNITQFFIFSIQPESLIHAIPLIYLQTKEHEENSHKVENKNNNNNNLEIQTLLSLIIFHLFIPWPFFTSLFRRIYFCSNLTNSFRNAISFIPNYVLTCNFFACIQPPTILWTIKSN